MKKLIILGLALVCLCFSGCGKTTLESDPGWGELPSDIEIIEEYMEVVYESSETGYYAVINAELTDKSDRIIYFDIYDAEGTLVVDTEMLERDMYFMIH